VYIGITAQKPEKRWKQGKGYEPNKHFFAAINKYGWPSFRHDILAEGLSREEACAMEIALIAEHDSTNPTKGYNLSKGGDKTTLGYHYSEESRQRISRSLVGKRKGIPHSPEHRERLRQAQRGKKLSAEHRAKLREVLGGRFQTDEARRRQRENTPKGSRHHRATAIRCENTGEIFQTIQEAADRYNLHRSNISAVCRGLQTTAGGLRWKYVIKE